MREAGATEVHMRIASPPITHPDFYGIDTPEQRKLLAASMTLEEMREFIGVDSLAFLSIDGLYRAVGESRPRPGPAAIHRPLLHRRLSDAAHRSSTAATAAASCRCSPKPAEPHDRWQASLEPRRARHRRLARHRLRGAPWRSPRPAPMSSRWPAPSAALEELDDEIHAAGGSATLVPLDLKDYRRRIDRLGAAHLRALGQARHPGRQCRHARRARAARPCRRRRSGTR